MIFKTLSFLAIYASTFITPPNRNFKSLWIYDLQVENVATSRFRHKLAPKFFKISPLPIGIFQNQQLPLLIIEFTLNQIPAVLINVTM